jgi:hypothetical protein
MGEFVSKIKEGFRRLKPVRREKPWWDGRNVVIRPDVPGRNFNPEAMVLFKTPGERARGNAAIDRAVSEMKDRIDSGDRTVADWLKEGDSS